MIFHLENTLKYYHMERRFIDRSGSSYHQMTLRTFENGRDLHQGKDHCMVFNGGAFTRNGIKSLFQSLLFLTIYIKRDHVVLIKL